MHHVGLDQFEANAGPGPWDDDLADIPAHYFDRGEFIVGSFEGRLVALPRSPAGVFFEKEL